jgi:hypothetical protein
MPFLARPKILFSIGFVNLSLQIDQLFEEFEFTMAKRDLSCCRLGNLQG